jgi:DNA-binding NtrC family response regulator
MDSKKLRILIADDEEGLRLSMAGILELEGHEVVTAENGHDAVEKVKQGNFDIAFLDIKMPGINGVETFKEIKRVKPETVVIMMTAYAMNELIKEAISEGAYACISKPFDMDKIIDTVKDVSAKPFVLVIDDDPQLCELLYERFKDNGFKVVTRYSGMEGIELVQRKIPDVVFLDVVMDGMDGIATLQKLKELLGENCPKTVIMSSQDLGREFQKAKELGAVECIRKPLDFSRIKEMICQMTDKDKGQRICIVDDDQRLCNTMKEVLSINGYNVDVAYSGQEIIDKIKNEAFKILILDIRLPDINGLDVYEKVKAIDPEVGVVFISGYASDENMSEIIRKNNYIYLHKPFEPDDLIKMLGKIRETKLKKFPHTPIE